LGRGCRTEGNNTWSYERRYEINNFHKIIAVFHSFYIAAHHKKYIFTVAERKNNNKILRKAVK
jgi:hypothetical protein